MTDSVEKGVSLPLAVRLLVIIDPLGGASVNNQHSQITLIL